MPKAYNLEDVFGVTADITKIYINRDGIDDAFKEGINQKKHISVYGGTKQGKTCLRKKWLSNNRYITISCTNNHTLEDINELILKKAGYTIIESQSESKAQQEQLKTNVGVNLFVEIDTEIGLNTEKQFTKTSAPLRINCKDPNEIIDALKKLNFTKYILLEDFHYLPIETQVDISYSLKTYYEESEIRFIIVGIWIDKNKLISYNGDLAGRLVSINADVWKPEQLKEVINQGCNLLNIEFTEDLIDKVIEESFDNVYFVQEICRKICISNRITKTYNSYYSTNAFGYFNNNGEFIEEGEKQSDSFLIKEIKNLTDFVHEIVSQHDNRFRSFITKLLNNSTESQKDIAQKIIHYILTCEVSELQDGIYFNSLLDHIGNTIENYSAALEILKNLVVIQFTNKIKPVIIEFDEAIMRINIVDKEFIIWRFFQNIETLI